MGAVASPEKPVADDGTATKTPSGGRVPRADTRELLMAYFCVLDVVQDDGSTGLRPPGRLSRVKPTVGLQSHVTEHVRTNVDRFSRRYRARLALGQDDGNDEDDRTALEDFAASLPPHRARVWILLPYLAALAITQLVVSVIGHTATISVLHDLLADNQSSASHQPRFPHPTDSCAFAPIAGLDTDLAVRDGI